MRPLPGDALPERLTAASVDRPMRRPRSGPIDAGALGGLVAPRFAESAPALADDRCDHPDVIDDPDTAQALELLESSLNAHVDEISTKVESAKNRSRRVQAHAVPPSYELQ